MSERVSFSHRVQFALVQFLVTSLSLVPLETARRIGAAIGRLGYWPFGIRKRVVVRQIAAAFPAWPNEKVRDVAKRAYGNLGRLSIESALTSKLGPEGVLSLFEESPDYALLERRHAEGRGIVGFTGHIGSWELAGAYLAARGMPTDVVARHMANPLFDEFLTATRSKLGMQVIYDADAVRRIPRGIKEGHLIGLVADQGVMGLASTFVTFFGRPAKTPRGPAVFALRYKVPIMFISAILQPSGKYRLRVEEIEPANTGDRDQDVDETVARFTASLERLVREYPDQYFWHHRRWKRQPPDTPPELREPL